MTDTEIMVGEGRNDWKGAWEKFLVCCIWSIIWFSLVFTEVYTIVKTKHLWSAYCIPCEPYLNLEKSLLRHNLPSVRSLIVNVHFDNFWKFTALCNHHHILVWEHFHHSKMFPHVLLQLISTPSPNLRQPLSAFCHYKFAFSRYFIFTNFNCYHILFIHS